MAESQYTAPATYTITFPSLSQAEVKVSVNGAELSTSNYSISGYSTSGSGTVTITSTVNTGDTVRIFRDTDVTSAKATFSVGASIKANDLNNNNKQLRFKTEEKIDSSDISSGAVSTDAIRDLNVATAKLADDSVTEPKLAANSVTNTQIADNSIDGAKLTDGTLDVDKIKGLDIVTTAEQNAGTPSWAGVDDTLASIGALERRHDVLYQNTNPGEDWPVGKIWYAHGNDQTLSIWSGTNWIGVSSGGTFISQPTVIWVDQANGDDSNDGHRIIDSMKTIKAAVASADHGDIILIAPGVYRETAPIDITKNNLSVVGQSLRSVFVHPTPATEENTLFRVNSGTLLSNMTFAGLKASGTRGGLGNADPDSIYGLPTNQGWVAEFYPNAVIYKSPYIQNCTNFADSGISNATQAENSSNYFNPNNVTQGGFGGDLTSGPTGGGIFIDGFAVSSSSPLRSMVVDSFTQITLDGPGILATNNAYAQLVSFFGTFCHYHAKALNGAQLNLSNCTTDYGRYGLIADGISPTANFQASVGANAAIGATTITVGQPSAGPNWYGSATRPQDNMVVEIGSNTYPVRSAVANGNGWDVTIERPDPHANATNLGLAAAITTSDTAYFYNRSYISTGGHTFEYVGSGTDYTAAPENGGVPVEANQVVNLRNGKVWQSSTDHNGKFKVGDTFSVNQRTGEVNISLDAYRPELVNDLTPQLGGDLDVNGKDITGTVKLNGLTYPSSDGGANHVITTDGSGNLTFQSVGSLQGSGITAVVDDTTPQLGGDLDVNGKNITGTIRLNSLTYPSSDGSANQVLTTNGSGTLSFSTVSSTGGMSDLVDDTTPQLGGDLDVNSNNITGTVRLNSLTYPSADGTANQVLKTDGSGTLGWTTITVPSGNVVDDTTPQLGGNLDVNGNDIVTTSNGDIDLDPNGSGVVVFKGNATKGSGQFKLNCENNSHAITIKGPPHSAAASYTLTLPNDDGIANQFLQTDGSGVLTWATPSSGSGGDIPSGTKMIFYESSAPSGWTQDTTLNDYGLRVVSGSGTGTTGSVNFGSLFTNQNINVTSSGSVSSETASGTVSVTVHGHGLTLNQMPGHRHAYTKVSNSSAQDQRGGGNNGTFTFNQGTTTAYTTYEGGTGSSSNGYDHDHGVSTGFAGQAHNHSISSLSGSGTLDMRLKYADVIICTKN